MNLLFSFALSSLIGALSVLGWEPFGWWPIPLFGYAVLLWLVWNTRTAWQAWLLGLAFGMGLHLFGSGWVLGALHSKVGMGLIPAVLSTLIFVIYLAMFTAVPCFLAAVLFKRNKHCVPAFSNSLASSFAVVGTFSALLTLGEWARGLFFNGFTSLALGYSLINTGLAGYAPVLGLYGLSWNGFYVSGMLVALMTGSRNVRAASLTAIVFIAGTGLALNQIVWTEPFGAPLRYRLIQSNVAQERKFDPLYMRQQTQRLAAMIESRPADLIVTAETAFPMFLNELPDETFSSLQQFSQRTGSHLFLGIATIAANSDGYNSVIHIDPDPGRIVQYNKVRLMPFGEYTPAGFGWFADSLAIPLKDLSAGGSDQVPFVTGMQRIGTLICHEDLTGQEMRRWLPAATLLLNPSNLAWFEGSLAIGQRIQIVRMRALESGRPILRVTNTGITAQIDSRGRVLGRLPQAVEGVLTGAIQPVQGLTPYARWGDWPVVLASAMLVLFAGRFRRRFRIFGASA
ncbi:MAG: apolipoprotein N-acyltransferase [Sulfuricella sp.]